MTTLTCDHCLLTFPEREAFHAEIGGERKVFCCNGCRGIYSLIREQGLDKFYESRSGWTPGPPEDAGVGPESFLNSVRKTGNEEEIDIALSGIRCASCIWLIEHYLSRFEGISDIRVNYATHRARIRWIPETVNLDIIIRGIKSLGYVPRPYVASDAEERLKREKRDLLVRFGTASFFSMQLMLYTTALYAGYFQGIDLLYKKIFELLALILATPVMFYCGYPFLKNALIGLRSRALTMDTLVFMGSFSAYLYSVIAIVAGGEVYFDTSAMIITLILLGRFIESGAKAKAAGAISSLISLQPGDARIIRDSPSGGNETTHPVPVSTLGIGDRIEVLPGEKIPVDCVVIGGSSEVDEAMLTGESMPVVKKEGKEVFAGTLNLNGRLILEAKRIGSDMVISRIIKAVEDAQARKAPIQRIADRVVGRFVPAIIILSCITFFLWLLRGSSTTSSLMNAISVMVIACPCALGLATPLAILIGSAMLYSKGILTKGGDIIETVARSNSVCFDKTGTLTAGKPTIINMVSYGIEKEHLHILGASVERGSEHVVARALRQGIGENALYRIEDFKAYPGKGVEGTLDGEYLRAGSPPFLRSFNVPITEAEMKDFDSYSSRGMTVIGLAAATKLKGWFVIADDLRKDAPFVVEDLKKRGYMVSLITGDHRSVAEEIGKNAGITQIEAEVLPAQKAEKIKEMRESGRTVLMIGDGVNDAAALTEADAGVAVGGATDIAAESADVVLMRSDLGLILQSLKISKKILSVIKQNLFWAFSYNLIAIPLAVSGRIHPIISAACMAVSSLVVVGNSLRLYKLK